MVSSLQTPPGRGAALAGLALAATSALPVAPGESSVLAEILKAFGHGWVDGVFALVLIGSPFVLGAAVALAVLVRSGLAVALLRVPVTVLYIELVLLALLLVKDPGNAAAPWALIGFAAVATLSGVARFVDDQKRGRAPGVAWLGRWGATLVVGMLGWLLLQVLVQGDITAVRGPWATFAAAAALAAACPPHRR